VMIGRFCVGLTGHLDLSLFGEFPVIH
jgi:hypothetical protein